MATLSPSFTKPIATPATGPLRGTPASINESDAPLTLAMEEEPLDSRMSESTRKHSRAVRPGQYADFNVDRPNLLELARVRPAALVRDLCAENLLAKNIEVLGEFLPPALIFLGNRILEVGL